MLSQIRESVGRCVSGTRSPASERARELFRQSFGLEAAFRPGQLEAITTLVDDRARLLVVQRTGWGKSLVYFLATRLLREQGAGPALLVSPLLALMRNQQHMADRLGIVAESISSANPRQWDAITLRLERNEIDLLMISPERLANPDFRKRDLPRLQAGIGMQGALQADGFAIGVLPAALERSTRQRDVRDFIAGDQLCLISQVNPSAGFTVGNAMGRNRLTYALSDLAIVIATAAGSGGTWAGATENLKRRWAPLAVWSGAGAPDGNARLQSLGAFPFSDVPSDRGDLLYLIEAATAHASERQLDQRSERQLSLLDL